MASSADPAFLALLVHNRLLSTADARAALAAGDAERYLVERGVVTESRWQEWVRTRAGTRPDLSRFALGAQIGQGGTARVFSAQDRKSGETVALKVLLPDLAQNATALDRFVRESRLMIALDHPNIVKGLRVAREGDTVYCSMRLEAGECLQDRLDRGEVLEEDEALRVVVQVASALAYLHGRGLVHRDVKPGNILLGGDGRAVLIDLGFAVEGGTGPAGASASDTTAGTVHYISPEQARGMAEIDVRADIYSLGATLYHLVTGSLPFSGGSSEEVLAKQVLESLSSDRIRALDLSPQMHYFIEKMMAKEKEIRFQTPERLAAEVQAYLDARERERGAGERERKSGIRRRRRRPLR
jgi:serine/threonine-protein kinase